jgi:hypothetical protein
LQTAGRGAEHLLIKLLGVEVIVVAYPTLVGEHLREACKGVLVGANVHPCVDVNPYRHRLLEQLLANPDQRLHVLLGRDVY